MSPTDCVDAGWYHDHDSTPRWLVGCSGVKTMEAPSLPSALDFLTELNLFSGLPGCFLQKANDRSSDTQRRVPNCNNRSKSTYTETPHNLNVVLRILPNWPSYLSVMLSPQSVLVRYHRILLSSCIGCRYGVAVWDLQIGLSSPPPFARSRGVRSSGRAVVDRSCSSGPSCEMFNLQSSFQVERCGQYQATAMMLLQDSHAQKSKIFLSTSIRLISQETFCWTFRLMKVPCTH